MKQDQEMAAFSYFLIFSPLLLYTKRDSPFIQFHAKQAALLFVIAIFLALLGKPFSYGNFLILATCLTGIIQANLGNGWRIPIIADIIETGVSPESVWKTIVHYLRVVRQMFVKSSDSPDAEAKNLELSPLSDFAKVEKLLRYHQRRIDFLERDFLEKGVLKGEKRKSLSSDSQKNIDHFLSAIGDVFPKAKKNENTFSVSFVTDSLFVLVGRFTKDSLLVILSGALARDRIESTLSFGNSEEEEEEEEERILKEIKKILS